MRGDHRHLGVLPAGRPASWLDQAEIDFSVVQRKVLTPNELTDLDLIRDRLAAFETRYNAVARPFKWTFTHTDLDDLLDRIDAHQTPWPSHSQHDHYPRRTSGRDYLASIHR